MPKKKQLSILTGESNLTEEQKREFEIRHRAEQEENTLRMVHNLAEKNPEYALRVVELLVKTKPKFTKKFMEIVERPRAGKRGPQMQTWEEMAFLNACLMIRNGVKKGWIEGNLTEAWDRMADIYNLKDSKSAENKFRTLKTRHAAWFKEASKGFERT